MVNVTLPDGSQKQFDKPITVYEIAASIAPSLAKAALAAEVNHQLVDTSYLIDKEAKLHIITDQDPRSLDIIRHSTAHLLAHAVKILFPAAQVAIGPVIENGFYYDFSFDRPFTPEDLEKIEAKMAEIAKADYKVERSILKREAAIELFEQRGETYKVEIIKEIPAGDELTVYQQGDFIDLCRGPHLPRTGLIKAFKLTKLAGAYLRGGTSQQKL